MAEELGILAPGIFRALRRGARRRLLDDLRETLLRMKRDGYFLADGIIGAACKAAGGA